MAAGDVKTYSGDEFSFVFGNQPASGLAREEFFSYEDNTDAFTDEAGADQEVARAKTNDPRKLVKLTVLQTSAYNDILSGIHEIDKSTPGGAGISSLFVRDRSGRTQYQAEKAWILKCENVTFGTGIKMRVWHFRVIKPRVLVGGN